MHRPRSQSAINRFRLASLLVCAKCLLVPVTAWVLIYSILKHDDDMTVIGLGMVILTVITALLQWLVSQRTGCPLCMTQVLAAKHCAKHRRARTFFGSHRFRVALSILCKNSFNCPYCNEATELVVRSNRHTE